MLSTTLVFSLLFSSAIAHAPLSESAKCKGTYRTTISVTQTNWVLEDGSVSTALPEKYVPAQASSTVKVWNVKNEDDHEVGVYDQDNNGYEGYNSYPGKDQHDNYNDTYLDSHGARPTHGPGDEPGHVEGGHHAPKQYEQKGKVINTWEQLDPNYDGWYHGVQLWNCPDPYSDHPQSNDGRVPYQSAADSIGEDSPGRGNDPYPSKAVHESNSHNGKGQDTGHTYVVSSGSLGRLHSQPSASHRSVPAPSARQPQSSSAASLGLSGAQSNPIGAPTSVSRGQLSASESQPAPSSHLVSSNRPILSVSSSTVAPGSSSYHVSSSISSHSSISGETVRVVSTSTFISRTSGLQLSSSASISPARSASAASSSSIPSSSSVIVVPPAEVTSCPVGIRYIIQTTTKTSLQVNYVSAEALGLDTDFTLFANELTPLTATAFEFILVFTEESPEGICRLQVADTESSLVILAGADSTFTQSYSVLAENSPSGTTFGSAVLYSLTCSLVTPSNQLRCAVEVEPAVNALSRDVNDGTVLISRTPSAFNAATFTLLPAPEVPEPVDELTCPIETTRYRIQAIAEGETIVTAPYLTNDGGGFDGFDVNIGTQTDFGDAAIFRFALDAGSGECRAIVDIGTTTPVELSFNLPELEPDAGTAFRIGGSTFSTAAPGGGTRERLNCRVTSLSLQMQCVASVNPIYAFELRPTTSGGLFISDGIATGFEEVTLQLTLAV